MTSINNDSNEEDELDEYSDDMKTKSGYLKDGFVVESDSDESDGKNNKYIEGAIQNMDKMDDEQSLSDTSSISGSEDSSELEEEPYYFSDEH